VTTVPALFDERPRFIVEAITNPHAAGFRWYVVDRTAPAGHWTPTGHTVAAYGNRADADALAANLNTRTAAPRGGSSACTPGA